MTLLAIAVLAAALTLALSLALPLAVRPLLVRLGIMDVPNERSSHDRPVIRGVGLSVLLAIATGGALAVCLYAFGPSEITGWETLTTVLGASLVAGLIGLREDLKGLSVVARSAVLLALSGAAVGVLVWLSWRDQSGPVLAPGLHTWVVADLPLSALLLLGVYGVLFVSSYVNAANFMDGLNGISGFHGVVAGLTFAVIGWIGGLTWLVSAGLLLVAGFAGFLPWNLTKPGAFLGDVGSYLLGGAVAVTSFAALLAGVPLLATIGPMVIYFGDVAFTLVRRVRRGERWSEPHKEHVYQRINQLGYTHVQASLMAVACTVLASLLGLATMLTDFSGSLALLAAGVATLVFYLLLPTLLPVRSRANS